MKLSEIKDKFFKYLSVNCIIMLEKWKIVLTWFLVVGLYCWRPRFYFYSKLPEQVPSTGWYLDCELPLKINRQMSLFVFFFRVEENDDNAK